MIVCRNIGQLGNNLFQIAAAIGWARKYGYEWGVDFGRGLSDPYSKIHECYPNLPKAEFFGTRFHEHPPTQCSQHGQHFNDCHFDYHELPDLGPNVVATGFFQSWKYFKDVQDEVKKVFALEHVPGYEDYVSIHVRRGDYLQHTGSFPPVDINYITKAMEMSGSKKFLVFSDDIGWCKQNIKGAEFSEGRNTLQDLSLMASCGHHIIANSTYSWWGAYLGHNPDKVVISPSCKRGNWFGMSAGVKKDVTDLLPPEWIQITFR